MKITLSDGTVKEYKNSDPEAFERIELPHSEAVELLAGMGQTLKVEHLNDGLAKEKTVSFYRQGELLVKGNVPLEKCRLVL